MQRGWGSAAPVTYLVRGQRLILIFRDFKKSKYGGDQETASERFNRGGF